MALVVVAGALANKVHNGGEAWVRMSWLRGLEELGCDVHLVEQIKPRHVHDADGSAVALAGSVQQEWFNAVVAEFDLAGRAWLLAADVPPPPAVRDVAHHADLLVNISGHLSGPLLTAFRRRAYVDIDPGFTQIWHEQGALRDQLAAHTLHFTIAENIGRPDCTIPTGGVEWRPVRQPVVLADWPVMADTGDGRFTTVGNLRGPFGRLEHAGRSYGLKIHELRRFVDLPERVDATFDLALAIAADDHPDRRLLEDHGWKLSDPSAVSSSPAAFRRFVQRSTAEFSVAQGVYVDTRSGWFSDRTIRYLASGRPALVQDTGFGLAPLGEGLVPFSTIDEAVDGAKRITADYRAHAEAARAVAERSFSAPVVLAPFLDACGLS